MAAKLTATAVEKYAARDKRREIGDGGCPGLYLVVQPSGAKSWALRFRRPNGRSGNLSLGPVSLEPSSAETVPVIGQPLTLREARVLAAEVHRQRALGRDVISDRRLEKDRRRVEREKRSANTFAAAARDFIDEHARKKTRRWRETAGVLGLHYPRDGSEPTEKKGGLAARWRDRDVRSIDGHDIYAVVDEARRSGTPGVQRKNHDASDARGRGCHGALSTMFGWLLRHRRVAINPCAGVHRPPPPPARDRVLTAAEVRWFWLACDSADLPHDPRAPRPYAPALRLLLLTGCRLSEVAGMRRSELSEDGATWTIPGARTKNKRAHQVPLPPLAREIVDAAPGEADLIFTTNGTTPISGWSKAKARVEMAMLAAARREFSDTGRDPALAAVPPWRIHDLRRSAATGMAELGIAPHIVEAALNHISGARAGVAGVYNRAAYGPEKKAALERWASHISGIVSGRSSNVVRFGRGA